MLGSFFLLTTNAGGLIQLAGATYLIDGTLTTTNVQLVGGTLADGTVLRGELTWVQGGLGYTPNPAAAAVTVASNSVLHIVTANDHNIPNCTLTNYGTVAWSDGVLQGGGGYTTMIYNFGLWDAQNDLTLNHGFGGGAGPLFSNAGIFRKSAGTGATTIANGVSFGNSGTVDVQTGTVNFNGGYTQAGGLLRFGIGSVTDFGRINISGNAPLTGTLNISLRNGYQPNLTNSFPVMTYGSSTGTFSAVTGCSIGNGLFFDAVYQSTQLLLVVKDGTPYLDSSELSIDGQFRCRLTTGVPGQTYIMQASTNLTNWVSLSTNTLPNCVLDFVDPGAVNFPRRFYRAKMVP